VAREKLLVDNEVFLLVASTDDDLYVFAVTTLNQQLQEYTFRFLALDIRLTIATKVFPRRLDGFSRYSLLWLCSVWCHF